MNLSEARKLLEEVAVVDNRKLTPELVSAWHKYAGHVDYKVAERALVLARRDASIGYLEPKHIIAKVRDATIELNDELKAQQHEDDNAVGDPIPICIHRLPVVKCDDCCRTLSEKGPRGSRDELLAWAKQHVFLKETI